MKTEKPEKLDAIVIEVAIAEHLNPRINLIVPNVWWGLGFRHELDLIVVSQSGYAKEVEIKISLSDFKADFKKYHPHSSNKIKLFYYAIPYYLEDKVLPLLPENAGLFIVNDTHKVKLIKAPKVNKHARKLSSDEIKKLHELSALRLWSLKTALNNLKKQGKQNEN